MNLLYFIFGAVLIWAVYRFIRGLTASKSSNELLEISIKSSASNSPTYNYDFNEKDEWEGSFWEVISPRAVSARLLLDYTDGAGKKTQRTVNVRQFGGYAESVLLIGHCELRNATRTFRADRIAKCVDQETGEIVSNVVAFLTQKYDQSPHKTKDTLLDEEYDTLRVLLYVGKADGQLRAAEKQVILETCMSLTSDSRLTHKDIDDLLRDMDVPTVQAFKLAIGRIAKLGAPQKQVVLAASEKLVATQASIHASEEEALDYMRKRFKATNEVTI
jgi:hypothetical protein